MASLREPGTFPGVIRGEGYEARCTIRATKVSLPGTSESALVDYSIEHVSTPPRKDAMYEVTASGQKIPVRFRNGQWLAAG